jgi:hypothetical protein
MAILTLMGTFFAFTGIILHSICNVINKSAEGIIRSQSKNCDVSSQVSAARPKHEISRCTVNSVRDN